MSDKEFWETIQGIIDTEPEPEFSEENLTKVINNEFTKPCYVRDYLLIHESYLILSECFGYSYNNEYEEQSNKQIRRRKTIREIKRFLVRTKIAIFNIS